MGRLRKAAWRIGGIGIVLSALSGSGVAEAQATGRTALAQDFFDQGKALVAKGDYAGACPKFEESERLDPGAGTAFNLADCYEHVGRTATAWSAFVDLADQLHRTGDARERAVRDRAAALQPRLTRLTIVVGPETRALGASVTRDGDRVDDAQWNVALPVDPGTHTIVVTAPGRETWRHTVTATGQGTNVEVVVPPLPAAGDAATEAPAASGPARPAANDAAHSTATSGLGGRRTVGLALAGAGVVGIAVGAVFGVMASSSWSNSQNECASATSCSSYAQAVSDHDSAVTNGTISTVAFIGGAALLGAGAFFWFTGGSPDRAPGVAVTPAISTGGASLSLKGAF